MLRQKHLTVIPEIHIKYTLTFLAAIDICNFASVSQFFKKISEDKYIWVSSLRNDFNSNYQNNQAKTAKELYKEKYIIRITQWHKKLISYGRRTKITMFDELKNEDPKGFNWIVKRLVTHDDAFDSFFGNASLSTEQAYEFHYLLMLQDTCPEAANIAFKSVLDSNYRFTEMFIYTPCIASAMERFPNFQTEILNKMLSSDAIFKKIMEKSSPYINSFVNKKLPPSFYSLFNERMKRLQDSKEEQKKENNNTKRLF